MIPELKSVEVVTPAIQGTRSSWLRPELVASWREIAAVLILTTGYYIYCSTETASYRWHGHIPNLRSTNYSCVHVMAGESAILSLLLLFLSWRGWSPVDLKIRIGWWSSLQALPLLFLNLAALIIGFIFIYRWNVSNPAPVWQITHFSAPITHLSWAVLIASNVVNAFLEEVTCICYAFNQFAAKHGPLFAFGLMLLLRLACHTWKSPGYLCITAVGFTISGLWYCRFRSVWPLILEHISFDLLLLYPQVR